MTKEEVKAWRKSRGLTQVELAEALGVKKLAVSRWERGERRVPAPLRLALRSLEAKNKVAAKHIKNVAKDLTEKTNTCKLINVNYFFPSTTIIFPVAPPLRTA